MVYKITAIRACTFRLLTLGLIPVIILLAWGTFKSDVGISLQNEVRASGFYDLASAEATQSGQSSYPPDGQEYHAPKMTADDLNELAVVYRLANISANSTESFDIFQYLSMENEQCQKELNRNNQSTVNYCPCISPYLKGPVSMNSSDDLSWSDIDQNINGDAGSGGNGGVLSGGEWKPRWCTPATRLAIVIPFRDRDAHLRIFLRHLIPILQRQLVHFKIFVVEQENPSIFNKAAMMNIGFHVASRLFPDMNCVMFHDVDTLVEDDRTLMRCTPTRTPTHYACAMKRWGYRLIYGDVFGGAISMRPEMFRRVNGFPLIYFGWGAEDDDMGFRVRHFYPVFRPPPILGRYSTLGHSRDSNPVNVQRQELLSKQYKSYRRKRAGSFRGLTDMICTVHSTQSRPFYTWIHASLSVDGLPYPKHNSSNYTMLTGACPDNITFSTAPRDLSLVTCRFLCDVPNPTNSTKCVGFTYYFLSESERLLGATVSRCVWLKEKCRLQQTSAISNVFTFYKTDLYYVSVSRNL